jgi:hypothetical protein
MTRKIYSAIAIAVLAGLLWNVTPLAFAQTSGEKSQAENNASDNSASEKKDKMPTGTYRVEFRITELEGEKKLNSRAYSVLLTGSAKSRLHAGTRVPIPSGDPSKGATQFQYFDVGENLECSSFSETERTIGLRFDIEFTNFAFPEQPDAAQNATWKTIVRQFHAETTSKLDFGKPTIISVLDDPSSKRTFQVEVTAARVKE